MNRVIIMAVGLVIVFGSCARPAETQEPASNEANTTESEPILVGEQRTAMTDQKMVEILDRIDVGEFEDIDFASYLGYDIPLPALSQWAREKQQVNGAYYSGGMSIDESNINEGAKEIGWLYIAAMADRIVFFYSDFEDGEYLLSDWLIVEKENTLVMILELASVSDPSSLIGERVEYSFGLEHWDFETDPLVYEQWFHPDAIIRIDPDAGTLELIEEVPADQYIMIEGV